MNQNVKLFDTASKKPQKKIPFSQNLISRIRIDVIRQIGFEKKSSTFNQSSESFVLKIINTYKNVLYFLTLIHLFIFANVKKKMKRE